MLGASPGLELNITEEIIAESVQRHSGHCMIADAVRARFPKAKYVSVDIQTIRFTDNKKGERYTYLTPRKAQVAIIKFDQGIKPEPFTFRLQNGQTTQAGLIEGRDFSSQSKNLEKGRKKRAAQMKAGHNPRSVKVKVGGKPPPKSVLNHGGKNNRRAFGLRAMEM